MSPAVAAIRTLLQYIRKESFGTVTELREKLVNAIDILTNTDSSPISIKSGCELLLRFITLTALDTGVSIDRCFEKYRTQNKFYNMPRLTTKTWTVVKTFC